MCYTWHPVINCTATDAVCICIQEYIQHKSHCVHCSHSYSLFHLLCPFCRLPKSPWWILSMVVIMRTVVQKRIAPNEKFSGSKLMIYRKHNVHCLFLESYNIGIYLTFPYIIFQQFLHADINMEHCKTVLVLS